MNTKFANALLTAPLRKPRRRRLPRRVKSLRTGARAYQAPVGWTPVPGNPFTVPGAGAGFMDIRKKASANGGVAGPVVTVAVPAYSGAAVISVARVRGQSNMEGNASSREYEYLPLSQLSYDAGDPMREFQRVFIISHNTNFQVQKYTPGINGGSSLSNEVDNPIRGVGPDWSLAYQFERQTAGTNQLLLLIKDAVGGQQISYFEKGTQRYADWQQMVAAGNAWIQAQGATALDLGEAWSQGESDEGILTQQQYLAALETHFANQIADGLLSATAKRVIIGQKSRYFEQAQKAYVAAHPDVASYVDPGFIKLQNGIYHLTAAAHYRVGAYEIYNRLFNASLVVPANLTPNAPVFGTYDAASQRLPFTVAGFTTSNNQAYRRVQYRQAGSSAWTYAPGNYIPASTAPAEGSLEMRVDDNTFLNASAVTTNGLAYVNLAAKSLVNMAIDSNGNPYRNGGRNGWSNGTDSDAAYVIYNRRVAAPAANISNATPLLAIRLPSQASANAAIQIGFSTTPNPTGEESLTLGLYLDTQQGSVRTKINGTPNTNVNVGPDYAGNSAAMELVLYPDHYDVYRDGAKVGASVPFDAFQGNPYLYVVGLGYGNVGWIPGQNASSPMGAQYKYGID